MTRLEKSATALVIAVCTAALIGCGDSTSPGSATLSDPAGLSGDVQSLGTPFQAPAFQSMSALSAGSTPLARTTGLLAALSPIRPASQPQGMSAKPALAVRALRPSFATAPTGPGSLIPATYWGHVFVWDATTSQYIDGAATGGPATGVRFTLYALDPLTGQPATPLNPIGWADLTDESTNTQFKLGVLVADGTTTYADYVVSATTTASSLLADATGYITDGTHRLDFSNSASVTASQVGLDYSLALNQPAVSAHLVATLAVGSTTSVLSATFGVTRGSETVVTHGVTIIGEINLASTMPYHASQMYARNMTAFFLHLLKLGLPEANLEDEITRETLTTRGGEMVHPRVREALGLPLLDAPISQAAGEKK